MQRRNKWLLGLRGALLALDIKAPGDDSEASANVTSAIDPGDGGTMPPQPPPSFEPKRLSRQASMLQNQSAVFRRRSGGDLFGNRPHVEPSDLPYGSEGMVSMPEPGNAYSTGIHSRNSGGGGFRATPGEDIEMGAAGGMR